MLLALLPLAAFWLLLIYHLGALWSLYEQYNYGWAVPFLCAWLIWRRLGHGGRRSKVGSPQTSDFGFRISDFVRQRPGIFWFLLFICLLAYATTRWLHEANPVWRLTSWLWAIEVIAITCLTLEWAQRGAWSVKRSDFRIPSPPQEERDRERRSQKNLGNEPQKTNRQKPGIAARPRFFLPLAFFLVAVPWPWPVEQFVVQAFTHLNSSATVEVLGFLGVPVAQHGNVLEISAGKIGIDEACSGIRSFQATLMLSIFFGELYSLTIFRRIACGIAGFAFAMLFNLGRTLLLVYVGASQGIKAISRWHDPAGTTILVACFICLWLLARFLRHPPPTPSAPPTSDLRLPTFSLSPSDSPRCRAVAAGGVRGSPHSQFRASSSLLPFVLLTWLLAVELGTEAWYRFHERKSATTSTLGTPWSIQLPSDNLEYKPLKISREIIQEFHYDEGIDVEWRDATGASWQLFYFRWTPARTLGRRVKVQRAKMHGPETCLPHAGVALRSDVGIVDIPTGKLSLPLHQYLFESEGKSFYVFFGIYEDATGSAVLANRRIGFGNRLRAAMSGSRNYGQRFFEVAVGGIEDPKEAQAALSRELEKLIKIN